jgi:hypothetical protein
MLLLSRSLSYLFIFISFWYYTAADQLIVQSERLRNFHGCSSEQQLQIRSAWWEAVNIAKTVRNRINFDHYAENDYFGRPSLNENFRDDIKGMDYIPVYSDLDMTVKLTLSSFNISSWHVWTSRSS